MERKIITLHYPKKKNYATNNMKGTHTHKKENKRDKKISFTLFSLIEIVPLYDQSSFHHYCRSIKL